MALALDFFNAPKAIQNSQKKPLYPLFLRYFVVSLVNLHKGIEKSLVN
jgi:hypothetical protein